MDKIWDRKSFEVGGHWPLWQGCKKRMTTQNRQKSKAKKKRKKNGFPDLPTNNGHTNYISVPKRTVNINNKGTKITEISIYPAYQWRLMQKN